MNLLDTLQPRFPNSHFNVNLSYMPGTSSGLLPSGFLTKILYAFLIYNLCTTSLAHLILRYLIILTISAKSSIYGDPHSTVFSSLPSLQPS
jgi:hypothetical protein